MKSINLIGKLILLMVLLAGKTVCAQAPVAGPKDGANEKVVKAWYTAFVKKDWNLMQQILADGFTFSSPLDDHISVKAFKERCWPNAYKIKKSDLDKVVVNGDHVVVISNNWTTSGKFFRNSDFFTLKDGKIATYECFFGPGVNYPNSGK